MVENIRADEVYLLKKLSLGTDLLLLPIFVGFKTRSDCSLN